MATKVSPGEESTMDMRSIHVSRLGGKLFHWAVGAVAGVSVVVAAGERFYATKEELSNVRMDVNSISIKLQENSRQIDAMRGEQLREFGKMETRLQRMEELLLSQ